MCICFSSESQLSQSAYLPLQLPYTVFGLGQTPNFIDKLEVGIPRNSNVSTGTSISTHNIAFGLEIRKVISRTQYKRTGH